LTFFSPPLNAHFFQATLVLCLPPCPFLHRPLPPPLARPYPVQAALRSCSFLSHVSFLLGCGTKGYWILIPIFVPTKSPTLSQKPHDRDQNTVSSTMLPLLSRGFSSVQIFDKVFFGPPQPESSLVCRTCPPTTSDFRGR